MIFPGFIGGSYQSQALTADCERSVNLYPEKILPTGRVVLYPTPGVQQLALATVNPGRAHFFANNREFAIIGKYLYEIDSAGNLTNRGTVALDSNPATICANGLVAGQLFITSGGNGYCYTLATNTLTQITALNGICSMGDFIDGYFIALDTVNSKFYISALFDGTSWTPGLYFAQRSLAGDRWLSMKVVNRYVWLWGDATTEVWADTGQGLVPFAPVSTGLIPYGITAPWSAAVLGREVVWLGPAGGGRVCVLRALNLAPDIVSSMPLETAIAGYANQTTAIGDVYGDRGHTFYLLHFDRDNASWAYDADMGIWHERGTWSQGQYVAWRPRYHVSAFGQHRMLDVSGSAVYVLDSSFTTDVNGLLIRRMRRAPAINEENQRIYYSNFEVDLERGLGNAVDSGSNPQVMLRVSNDNGRTWLPEQWASAGKIGEYQTRVRWNRLGMARRRVFEISMTDPTPWMITGAYLQTSQPAQRAA